MQKVHFRKIISALLVMLLMLQGVGVAASAISSVPQLYYCVIDEKDADGNYVHPYYVNANGKRIPSPQPEMVSAAEDTLPTSYDARTENIITSPKYQSGSGSCWAFSTISCMETSMIKQGYTTLAETDYSEAYMAWFGQRQRAQDPNDPTYGDGRNITNPFIYGANWYHSGTQLMRGSGVQLESNARWIETRDSNVMMQMEQPESDRYLSYARLRNMEMTNDRAVAKQMVIDKGSVYTNYYDDTGINDRGYNKTNTCYYQNATTSTNHAVTIVGWDDNYPATNFNAGLQPEHNGAWLIKGSWSTRYGNGGYYWLAYDDPSCTEFVSFTAMPADTFDNIYQYDGAYCAAGIENPASSASMANLFYAKETQLLTHVAAYNPNFGTTVKAMIYTGGTNYTLSGTDPTANMELRATKTVYNVGYGYWTLELNTPIRLKKNEAFTVVIKLTNPNASSIRLPIENTSPTNVTHSTMTYAGNVGESFMNLGQAWYDTNNYSGMDLNNVPVKAMTRNIETVPPELTLTSAPTKTTYFVGDTLDTTGLVLSYSDEYGDVSTVTEGYVCTPTLLDTVGTQTVTVTYNDLSVTFDVTVEEPPVTQGVLSAEGGEAYPGQTVQVVLRVDVNPGIAAMRVHLDYDDMLLTLTDVQNGTVFDADSYTPGNDLSLTPYTLIWMDALGEQNHASTGTLATLTFRISDEAAAGETPITLTVDSGSTFNVDLQEVPFTVRDGTVRVKALETPTLALVSAPTKTEYYVGDALDTTGLALLYCDRYGVISDVTEGFVCSPAQFDTAGTQTVTVTYNGLSVTFDVTVQASVAPQLVPKDQTETVIDEENGLLYGLDLDLNADRLFEEFIDVQGTGSVRVVYTSYIGTGTEVQVLDGADAVVASYHIVVFGDVDGDGVVTSDDIRAVKGHVSGAEELTPGSAQYLAADVDGDGVVDMQDAVRMKGMISGAVVVNQATRRIED